MSTPRHRTAPDASYFVTTKCAGNRSIFQLPETAEILVNTVYQYRARGEFALHEFVVMPDHIHLLLTPSPTSTLERVMQLIKGGSSHEIHRVRGHKMQIWQEGFHDWTVRDGEDWRAKAEYIAMNPVRAGLAQSFRDWPYSSASGRFELDPMPDKYSSVASGAEAPYLHVPPRGLKPPPPKETGSTPGLKPPPPKETGSTPGLKPRPPKEETMPVRELKLPPPREQKV